MDNEDTEGATGASEQVNQDVSTPVRDTGAVPKETKQVEDKATLTENSSSTSSMFSSAHGNGNESNSTTKQDGEKQKFELKRGQPLTFEEMGKQLKAHIEEFQKLAVPVGPPANPAVQPPQLPRFPEGIYPHPAPAPPQPRVYHPSKFFPIFVPFSTITD